MSIKTILLLLVLSVIPLSGAETDVEKAVAFRKTEQLGKAERLLKKYSSPANFDSLKAAEKIEFLRGLLELAHIRALKDDVPGALVLLNWAEGRKDPYQRAIACVKYAEILLDLGEFERASAYLKNADEVINSRATEEDTGAAIGQGGVTADTGAVWRDLRDDAAVLKAEIESEELKKKFGASYGNYVKLRRLQVLLKRSRTPRYLKEALKLADELIETDPASQFAAAAGYLKGEIMASRLKEESPKKEIKEVKDYLDKFVRQQPDGIYRGEALMLLGKISLEIEWNAKDAEKYYSQALDWFRKAREKRDAVSLYAAMNDDLKKQSAPTQKPTTLNQWKRIVYHDEAPLKLYNTANAPVWYMDDKEKNCVYALGFLAFADGKYDVAEKYWRRVQDLSPDDALITPILPTTVSKRLMKACQLKGMMFWPEEKKSIKDSDLRLKIQHAEYLALLERFSDSITFFKKIRNECKMPEEIAVIETGIALSGYYLFNDVKFKESLACYKKIIDNKKLQGVPIYGRALMENGKTLMSMANQEKIAMSYFISYQEMYKNGRYFREAQYMEARCLLSAGKINEVKKIHNKLKGGDDPYEHFLLLRINEYEIETKKQEEK